MSSLENGINGDIRDRHVDTTGTIGDLTDMEASLKKEKARAKSNFTRLKNKVLFLIEQRELPSHQKIQEACSRMDSSMESAMDVMTSLSKLYTKYKEKGKNDKVSMLLKNSEIQMHTTTEGQNNDIVYETEPTPPYIRDASLQNEQF